VTADPRYPDGVCQHAVGGDRAGGGSWHGHGGRHAGCGKRRAGRLHRRRPPGTGGVRRRARRPGCPIKVVVAAAGGWSWVAARAAIPAVGGPDTADQAADDDHHTGQCKPEHHPGASPLAERITLPADVDATRLSSEGRQHLGILGRLPDLMSPNRAREEEQPRPRRDPCLSRPSRWAIAAASPRPATPAWPGSVRRGRRRPRARGYAAGHNLAGRRCLTGCAG
jgi:hypothetical protein